MGRIPRSAREQLVAAERLGHTLSVVTRTRADFPDAPPKYFITCTCGYRSTVRRSRSAANGALVVHLSKVLAEADDSINGGASRGSSSAERVASSPPPATRSGASRDALGGPAPGPSPS